MSFVMKNKLFYLMRQCDVIRRCIQSTADSDLFGTLTPTYDAKRSKRKDRKKQWRKSQLTAAPAMIAKDIQDRKITVPDPGDYFGTLKPSGSVDQRYRIKQLKRLENTKLIFGSSSDNHNLQPGGMETIKDFDLDGDDGVKFSPSLRKFNPEWYAEKCDDFGKQGKIAECLAMLQVRMLTEDRVRPVKQNFNIVLKYLGHRGYPKQSLKLIELMQSYGLDPNVFTYCCAFDACSNSPESYKAKALKISLELKKEIEKRAILSMSLYHSMIKAFAHLDDFVTAFSIVDEMSQNGVKPNSMTYSHLLHTALGDKENGFYLAIKIWRKMTKSKLPPNVNMFNLLLRITRDCSMSDEFKDELCNINTRTIDQPEERSTLELEEHSSCNFPVLPAPQHISTPDPVWKSISNSFSNSGFDFAPFDQEAMSVKGDEIMHYTSDTKEQADVVPNQEKADGVALLQPYYRFKTNILNPKFRMPKNVVSIGSLKTAKDRFMLFGGLEPFLMMMKFFWIKPDIKTFTQCFDVIPNELSEEAFMLDIMERNSVKPDTMFINKLIERRAFRQEEAACDKAISLLHKFKLKPDINTFCAHALIIRDKEGMLDMIKAIKSAKLEPNCELFLILVKNAFSKFDSYTVIALLSEMENCKVSPSIKFLSVLSEKVENCRSWTLKSEETIIGNEFDEFKIKPLHIERDYLKSEHFKNGFVSLNKYLPAWLKRVNMELPVDPWMEVQKTIHSDVLRDDWEKRSLYDEERMGV